MPKRSLAQKNALLKARLAEVEAALADAQAAQRRLEAILGQMQREKFGKRSEKLSPEQFNLPMEDVELAQGVLEAAQEKAEAALKGKPAAADKPRTRNRGHLPAHLPRVERIIEPVSLQCPCGCGEMIRIGEDVSERLDVIPAQFRVLVTRRPKYACLNARRIHRPRAVLTHTKPLTLAPSFSRRAHRINHSGFSHRLGSRSGALSSFGIRSNLALSGSPICAIIRNNRTAA